MDSGFENKVGKFIARHDLFAGESKVLAAISGGADSVALMHVLAALRERGVTSAEFICAHINHQLRDEADGDEEFVAAEAERLGISVVTRSVDVRGFGARNKLSIESAGRMLRMQCLVEIARGRRCSAVVTAHHKDDNAETIIQRLVRGTGFRGLGGIWPNRTFESGIRFLRPLLCVTRVEIIEYLEQRKLRWCVDETNLDCRYRRNFIRHRLIPEVQRDCSVSVSEMLLELAESSRDLCLRVCERSDEVWRVAAQSEGDEVTLDAGQLQSFSTVVKVEVLRRSLVELGSGERDLTERHYEQMLKLAGENVSGREIELPGGFLCRREYGKLVFSRVLQESRERDETLHRMEINVPGQTQFGGYVVDARIIDPEHDGLDKFKVGKDTCVEWFDLDKLIGALTVGFRREGGRFWPLGLSGEKKLGKFFTTEKVPRKVRDKALVVADIEKIIWVWPIRMGEQAKVTNETVKILELKIKETN